MSESAILPDIELVPVIELEPYTFATSERPFPDGVGKEELDQLDCYWRESLSDSGVMNLRPIRAGSWHVPTGALTDQATPGKLPGSSVSSQPTISCARPRARGRG